MEFDPESYFAARHTLGSVPVEGRDDASVQRIAASIDWVLERADQRLAAGLEKQGVTLYVIENEAELESNPALLDFLLDSRPLELIYMNLDGIDETQPENRGTVAQKLMQLFVYYPLELDPEYADLKRELESAFIEAIRPREETGGRPVYDPDDYSNPDEAHPHMGPPFYTALGAYLGLGYEIHSGLTRPTRNETEYYPISDEEMNLLDPALIRFLDTYLLNDLTER